MYHTIYILITYKTGLIALMIWYRYNIGIIYNLHKYIVHKTHKKYDPYTYSINSIIQNYIISKLRCVGHRHTSSPTSLWNTDII